MKSFKRNNIELMAPVGSFESLSAAIQGGADSIYFGAGHLNMRARSSFNFTLEDIETIVAICKKNEVLPYLALNTIIYEEELEEIRDLIDKAKQAGVAAIIATDPAILQYAHDQGISIHLSTQLNISNSEALRFYSRFADVVVLARELTLEQISTIARIIETEQITGPSGHLIKLELFIHGALCMSISGKCYLSLHQYNYSANRGSCLQACRRSYIAEEKDSGKELEIDNHYIMSPKDLYTIHFLNKILDSGVSVLKIEGRARSAEYVKTVTACYNEAIWAYINGTYSDQDQINQWKEQLATVFNRGFWDGYYLGQPLGEWSDVYGSKSTKQKEYIGDVTNYYAHIKVGEFYLQTGDLHQGEEILIIGPTTGVVKTQIDEIRVDDQPVQTAQKGEYCSIKMETFLRRSDKIYKWMDRNTPQK